MMNIRTNRASAPDKRDENINDNKLELNKGTSRFHSNYLTIKIEQSCDNVIKF